MSTFDDRVRTSIRALADYAPSATPAGPTVPPPRARRRRPVRAAVAVAGAIALVTVGVWVASRAHHSKLVTVMGGGPPATGTAAALPSGPLAARTLEASAWTGREWLIWGGIENNNMQPDDGASYDPATGRWTMLPRAPLAGRQGAASVWTGTQWIIYGGSAGGRPFVDGASYDPTTNSWQRLPPAPSSLDDAANLDPQAVWTGTEMIVVADRGAAAYHPATRTWEVLTAVPGQSALLGPASSSGGAVWTGTEMVVLLGAPDIGPGHPSTSATTAPVSPTTSTPVSVGSGARSADPEVSEPHGPGYHLAAYTPRTGRWTSLPDGGLHGDANPDLLWTGSALVVLNTGVRLPTHQSGINPDDTVVSYDFATRRWTRLPPLPTRVSGLQGTATWTGTSLLLWDGGPTVIAYTPSTGAWSTVTSAPRPALEYPAMVWTGTTLLVWGGLASDLDGPGSPTEITAAASYVPPIP